MDEMENIGGMIAKKEFGDTSFKAYSRKVKEILRKTVIDKDDEDVIMSFLDAGMKDEESSEDEMTLISANFAKNKIEEVLSKYGKSEKQLSQQFREANRQVFYLEYCGQCYTCDVVDLRPFGYCKECWEVKKSDLARDSKS